MSRREPSKTRLLQGVLTPDLYRPRSRLVPSSPVERAGRKVPRHWRADGTKWLKPSLGVWSARDRGVETVRPPPIESFRSRGCPYSRGPRCLDRVRYLGLAASEGPLYRSDATTGVYKPRLHYYSERTFGNWCIGVCHFRGLTRESPRFTQTDVEVCIGSKTSL